MGAGASLYWQPSTLGPESGEEAACQEFRQFWGDRSQLRRFQDGSVKEVVVWGGDREEVVGDIVQAVLDSSCSSCWSSTRYTCQSDHLYTGRPVLYTCPPVLYT